MEEYEVFENKIDELELYYPEKMIAYYKLENEILKEKQNAFHVQKKYLQDYNIEVENIYEHTAISKADIMGVKFKKNGYLLKTDMRVKGYKENVLNEIDTELNIFEVKQILETTRYSVMEFISCKKRINANIDEEQASQLNKKIDRLIKNKYVQEYIEVCKMCEETRKLDNILIYNPTTERLNDLKLEKYKIQKQIAKQYLNDFEQKNINEKGLEL